MRGIPQVVVGPAKWDPTRYVVKSTVNRLSPRVGTSVGETELRELISNGTKVVVREK